MAESESRMTPLRRIVLVGLALFTAWHVFATFLWIAPPSGLRQVVPGTLLQQYMIPMFGQSWSVFAPEPINGDFRLQVRAVTPAGGERDTTEWVDATAAELSMLTHSLTPPRAAIQSTEIASQLISAFKKLDAEQQEIVALGFYNGGTADWSSRLEAALISAGDEGAARSYLRAEQVVNAYSTQVAQAMWGPEVMQVQFIVSRQNIIPFEQRHDPEAERPAVQPAATGWRGPIVRDGQSQEAFASVFVAAVEASLR